MRNPFLPSLPKKPIRWKVGPVKGTVGIPSLPGDISIALASPDRSVINADGCKPKESIKAGRPRTRGSRHLSLMSLCPDAGKLNYCTGTFFLESNTGWGANLDMLALAHGPVGCGAFTQATRLNLPEFVQGIESFTGLHACTDLSVADLEDGGDTKLAQSLDEAQTLFPLARGITVLNEDPIAIVDSNVKGITKAKAQESGRLIISRSCENIRCESHWIMETGLTLKAAASRRATTHSAAYDVALPFHRRADGLVWIVAKLLHDIGLTPIHELTGSSTSDMARICESKLVIGFGEKREMPVDYCPGNAGQFLKRWFGIPLLWTCFVSPSATDASLRSIAACFDAKIRRRAEAVISENRKKVEAVIASYRPRLQGKLVLHFDAMSEDQLEPYRVLGLRIGNCSGWTGKTGKWRIPRLVCNPENLNEKTIDSYIAEAKPDLVLHYLTGVARGEFEWRKRGENTLPSTPLFDGVPNSYWGYDGFACFAAQLDRQINAPWRQFWKPPWPIESG